MKLDTLGNMTEKHKQSIVFDVDDWEEVMEAMRLRADKLGIVSPKTGPILRDVLVGWAKDEKQQAEQAEQGSLFTKGEDRSM